MPDYDSKSIPVLNDVINDDAITDEHEIVVLSNLNASPDDDDFDLFVDDLTGSVDASDITPEIGDIDDQDDGLATGTAAFGAAALKDEAPTARISNEINTAFGNNEKSHLEEDNSLALDLPADEPRMESALVDYGVKEAITLAVPVEIEAPLATTLEEPVVETIRHHAAIPAMPTISLETLTEDIVKQIMPGLEAQLRHRVQQALAEKLPEALVTSASTGDDQSNDHEQ